MEERAALDVRRAEQLAHVPAAAGLVRGLLLGEGVGLVGEVAAEDDRVGPDVADDVGGEVRRQGLLEPLADRRAPGRRCSP